jgi:hypothetical protein
LADQLGDLRDYGVSEAAQSVHPLGNPMSHSTRVGFNCPPTTCGRQSPALLPVRSIRLRPGERKSLATGVGNSLRSIACTVSARFSPKPDEARHISVSSFVPGPAERLSIALGGGQEFGDPSGKRRAASPSDIPKPFPLIPRAACFSRRACIFARSVVSPVSIVAGVGHDPDSVASVRRTNGARWYAMPLRVIPDLGQGPENNVQPSTKQRCHVLQDDDAGSNHASGSNHFPEESRTGSGKSGACTGKGDVLAGEASADNVGIGILRSRHVTDVHGIGKPERENARGVGVKLGHSDRVKAARALEPEVEAANASEQGKDVELAHSPATAWSSVITR